jgi:hypothetical protein
MKRNGQSPLHSNPVDTAAAAAGGGGLQSMREAERFEMLMKTEAWANSLIIYIYTCMIIRIMYDWFQHNMIRRLFAYVRPELVWSKSSIFLSHESAVNLLR